MSSDEELPVFDLGLGGPSMRKHANKTDASSLNKSIEEMSAKELRIELKKREAQDKRRAAEMKKLEKQKERAEKQLENEIKKARKQADTASRKEDQPQERMKQMVVMLDSAIAENSDLMTELVTQLSESSVEYRINKVATTPPGVLLWRRKVAERNVDDQAQILTTVTEEEQSELLVVIEAPGFAGLVHCSKLVESGRSLPAGSKTLRQFVESVLSNYPNKRVSVVVQGLEAFFRGIKTRQNRRYKEAVTGKPAATKGSNPDLFSDVTRVDCEEVCVGLQLSCGCVVKMCESGEDLAEYVITMTKAISESHYRQSNPFSFHSESGQGPSKQALTDSSSKVSLIFKHQLMQFNNLSEQVAMAIVNHYPSPSHLLTAYESCDNTKAAQMLLKDIEVRRGVGVVATVRKIGPAQSKRIHLLMTSTEPSIILQ